MLRSSGKNNWTGVFLLPPDIFHGQYDWTSQLPQPPDNPTISQPPNDTRIKAPVAGDAKIWRNSMGRAAFVVGNGSSLYPYLKGKGEINRTLLDTYQCLTFNSEHGMLSPGRGRLCCDQVCGVDGA